MHHSGHPIDGAVDDSEATQSSDNDDEEKRKTESDSITPKRETDGNDSVHTNIPTPTNEAKTRSENVENTTNQSADSELIKVDWDFIEKLNVKIESCHVHSNKATQKWHEWEMKCIRKAVKKQMKANGFKLIDWTKVSCALALKARKKQNENGYPEAPWRTTRAVREKYCRSVAVEPAKKKSKKKRKSKKKKEKYRFDQGCAVLCYHNHEYDYMWKAEVLKRRRVRDGDGGKRIQYRVHYVGYKAKWDEWVDGTECYEMNKANIQKSKELEKELQLTLAANKKAMKSESEDSSE